MASARIRAINKCRKYMLGEKLEPAKQKHTEANKKIAVMLKSHGYGDADIARRTGIPGRTVRAYYAAAGKPMVRTSADIARLLMVDRSTVLRHAKCAVKTDGRWDIKIIPKITKPSERHSKNYTEQEIKLLRSTLPDSEVAKRIGRTENAVHIKRWRLL